MIRLVIVLILALLPSFAYAQPHFDTRHQQLLMSYHSKFGLPSTDNEAARAWTRRLAEQFAFTFAGEGWGHKAGGNGRPPSTDVIARNCCGGLWGYDVILSQGIPSQSLISNPDTLNLAGQEFIPVSAVNHLGTSSGGGTNPPPNPPPTDLTPEVNALKLRVTELERLVAQLSLTLNAEISALKQKDELLTKQLFELSDYARSTDAELGNQIKTIDSKPIPVGCRARSWAGGVNCSLVFQ